MQDQNQVNQSNEHYTSLRARANEEGDAMAKSFAESHEAYARGDGALAKELSNKGKQHQAEMERLNREASEWIFVGAYALVLSRSDIGTDSAVSRCTENNKVRIMPYEIVPPTNTRNLG